MEESLEKVVVEDTTNSLSGVSEHSGALKDDMCAQLSILKNIME